MTDSRLPCPECGAHLIAPQRARWVEELQGLRRDRKCANGHSYPTIERIPPRDFLRATMVVGATRSRPYSTNLLQSDLSLKLAPVLSKETRNAVVDRVEKKLVMDFKSRRPRKELGADVISSTVVQVLKEFARERNLSKRVADALRRAHVLYALSQESLEFTPDDREPVSLRGDGFDALPSIMSWLVNQYPQGGDISRQPPTPHHSSSRTDTWHTLRVDAAPRPTTLLRRTIAAERDVVVTQVGEVRVEPKPKMVEEWQAFPFEYRVYLRSVQRAFAGRDNYEHLTRYSAQWVLFALAGQDTVRVSDLVATTTQCLRRVDAIASLRWAIIAKNLTPAALVNEIRGMVEWPAPRLLFDPDAAADMRTSHQMLPERATRDRGR